MNPNEFKFSYPNLNEQLDAQDFLLQGTGKPGMSFDVLQNGSKVSTEAVGSDGEWSYFVEKPTDGDNKFQLQADGIIDDVMYQEEAYTSVLSISASVSTLLGLFHKRLLPDN